MVGSHPRQPLVSVLVTTHQGHDRISACLSSLAGQTLAAEQFEVLVVQNGPNCPTPAIVDEFRARHPRHRLRVLEMSTPGLAHARNVGLRAARGRYVTYVDDDDWVTPGFLEGLLRAAAPGVVAVAPIGDVPDGSCPERAVPDFDNYFSRPLRRFAGQVVDVLHLPPVLYVNAGKLLPTDVARSVRYDEGLASGEDFVYWLHVLARYSFRFRVLSEADGAAYVRAVRPGSLGRQEGYEFGVTQRLECIAAVRSVDQTDPQVAAVARRMVRAQARHVNKYLTRHPDDHARVVRDAEGVDLTPELWQTINRGLARDLALLYCFTPFLDTSGLVAAKRLRERGLVTDVVSHQLGNVRHRDPASKRIAMTVVDEARTIPGRAAFDSWPAVRRYAEAALAEVRDLEAAKGRYRSVYSRSMAVHSHFAAALVKLRRPEIHWVAEFSDPLLRNPLGRDRPEPMTDDPLAAELVEGLRRAGHEFPDVTSMYEWAELLGYALADEIVFTNENQREFMLGYCRSAALVRRAREVSRVSHHPTLPAEFYAMASAGRAVKDLDRSRVNIAYFGVFYATRGLTEVIDAIRGLAPEDRRRVVLRVFTDKPHPVRVDVVRAGMADVIDVREYLPFLEFLDLTRHVDVLLVNDAVTAGHHPVNPYLPSKVADYLGSGTPVWALHEPGSVLSGIDTAYRSPLDDTGAASKVLRQIIDDLHPGRQR